MAPINDADVKLMLAIIGSAEMIKTDNEKLANIIGGGTTANAIRQRVAKIKNQAKAVIEGTDVDITFGGSTTGKAKATPKKPSAGGKNASADDDEEESAAPTPTPKKRAANGKAKGTPRAKKVKDEKDEKGEEGAEKGGEEGVESPVTRVKFEQSGEV